MQNTSDVDHCNGINHSGQIQIVSPDGNIVAFASDCISGVQEEIVIDSNFHECDDTAAEENLIQRQLSASSTRSVPRTTQHRVVDSSGALTSGNVSAEPRQEEFNHGKIYLEGTLFSCTFDV